MTTDDEKQSINEEVDRWFMDKISVYDLFPLLEKKTVVELNAIHLIIDAREWELATLMTTNKERYEEEKKGIRSDISSYKTYFEAVNTEVRRRAELMESVLEEAKALINDIGETEYSCEAGKLDMNTDWQQLKKLLDIEGI